MIDPWALLSIRARLLSLGYTRDDIAFSGIWDDQELVSEVPFSDDCKFIPHVLKHSILSILPS